MSFCEFCGYDVLGPCDNARLAERCQSLHSTCGFCGHNVYLTCDDAEKAERCRKRRGVTLAGAVGTDAPLGDAPQRGGRRTGDLRRRLPASLGALLGPLNMTGTGAQALGVVLGGMPRPQGAWYRACHRTHRWTERHGSHGWRCLTCHPPVQLR